MTRSRHSPSVTEPLADGSQDLIRQTDNLYKLLSRLAEVKKKSGHANPLKPLEEARKEAVEHLRLPRYFWQQARWLQERFPGRGAARYRGARETGGLQRDLRKTTGALHQAVMSESLRRKKTRTSTLKRRFAKFMSNY